MKNIENNIRISVDAWPPNDQYYSYQNQFYNTTYNINIPRAWNFTAGNSEIKVGIVDHGIDYTHPDLGNGFGAGYRVRGGWDYKDNDGIPLPGYPNEAHATPIAGMIGALNWNNIGIIGIAGGASSQVESGCQIFSFRVTDEQDSENGQKGIEPALVAEAVLEASTDPALNDGFGYGVNVINCSFGGISPNYWDWSSLSSQSYYSSFVWAYLNNVVVTTSRGNSGNTQSQYPANFSNGDVLISVSGVNNDGAINSGSSYGDGVTIAAPWTLNYTTANGGTYQSFSGTSNSSPMVAGVAALILSELKERNITAYAEDVREILKISAQSTGDPLHYGAGRLDAGNALYISSDKFGLEHFIAVNNRSVVTVSNPTENKLALYYPFGIYVVHETKRIRANISSPNYYNSDSVWIWANGYSNGLNWGNPSYGMPAASLISKNGTEWIFEMYVYDLYDVSGTHIGWYPYDPSSANIRVTVLGRYNQVNVNITSAQFPEGGGSGGSYELGGNNVGGSYTGAVDYGSSLKAIPPNNNWSFYKWNDNTTSNPRTLTANFTGYAIFKAIHKSDDAIAFSNNGQRRLIETKSGSTTWLHQVYTSLGHVWIEHSSNNGSSWIIGNNGQPLDGSAGGKNPSIAYTNDSWNNYNYIGVVWQQPY
ncbi:MAG: S8 family serine peptidase, partial [Ignavibacteriaceae bacterium]